MPACGPRYFGGYAAINCFVNCRTTQSTVVRSYRPKCTDFPGTLRAPQIMTVALVAMNAESDRPYLIATVAFQIGRPRFACPNKGTGIPGNGVPVPTC